MSVVFQHDFVVGTIVRLRDDAGNIALKFEPSTGYQAQPRQVQQVMMEHSATLLAGIAKDIDDWLASQKQAGNA